MICTPSLGSRGRSLDIKLDELRTLISDHSITRSEPGQPDFTLASGSATRYYCDTKKVTLSAEGSRLTGEVLFALLDGTAQVIGGLELGATFIATAVALVSGLNGRPMYGFTVRDKPKSHGNLEAIAESFHPDGRKLLCAGRRVAVVDDVVTQGGSILRAINAVKDQGCEIMAVISLVDRNEGGGNRLRELRYPYLPLFNAKEPGVLTINDALYSNSSVRRSVST